jgi:hypothetical protein
LKHRAEPKVRTKWGRVVRRLIFDQFEFDSFSSEESLEIVVAKKQVASVAQFGDLREFVAASAGTGAAESLGQSRPFNDRASYSSVREYLKRFANIDVPDPNEWEMYVLFEDALEWDGVFEAPDMFIRYHWSSTA